MAKINKDNLKIGVTFTRCKDCDRVEVVRCAECRHYNPGGCANGFGWCEYYNSGATDYHYCSHGERRLIK